MNPDMPNNPNDNRPGNEDLFAPRYANSGQHPDARAFPWQPQGAQDGVGQQAHAGLQHSAPTPVPTPTSQPQPQPTYQSQNIPQQTAQPSWPPATPVQSTSPSYGPQYGGQMSELPPLATPGMSTLPSKRKPHKKLVYGLLGVVGLILIIIAGLIIWSLVNNERKSQDEQIAPVTYLSEEIAELAKNGQVDSQHVQQLDKTSAFYTVFKQAAIAPAVQTKWDVYYTTNEQDKRGAQFSMYNVAIDYRNKQFAYQEDSHSTIGTIQDRCVNGQLYSFNSSKLVVSSGWQPAADSSSCKFEIASTRMNDGMNAGGLTNNQANTFVQEIHKSQVVTVNSLGVEVKNNVPYLKFDVNVTPRKAAEGIYWGMQNFMTAFQSTGINPDKHPYAYFGSGADGLHLVYYADASTQLPVYAQMSSTPSYNATGQPVTPESWSHRYIEYTFPEAVTQPTLDDSKPITFTSWPDH